MNDIWLYFFSTEIWEQTLEYLLHTVKINLDKKIDVFMFNVVC